ncbi:hypothetical protein ACQPXH_00415 [Nocardia sp. CA-135953]|uniref:WXG100 family type VII secretion target n=1 Tax=Nocardia sp. CA-135953 TaxID=3239978 RepID=UPI003D984708
MFGDGRSGARYHAPPRGQLSREGVVGRRTSKEIADDIRAHQSQLAHISGFGSAGVDPAYVPDRESFDSYRHQQIWDLVHEKIDPGAMGQIASEWSKRADKLHELFDAFSREVKSEFASWSGTFAATAQQSTDAFVAAGGEQHDTALTVQRLMDLNASAAQTVKAAIPPPPPPYQEDADAAQEAANGADRRTAYNLAASEAEATAQDTMNFVYNPTLPASGDSVPRFVPLPPGPGTAGPGDTGQQQGGDLGRVDGGASPSEPNKNGQNGEPGDGKPSEQPPGENSQPDSLSTSTQTKSASLDDPAAMRQSSTPSTSTAPAGTNPVDKPQVSSSSTVPSIPGSSGSGVPGSPRGTSGVPGSPGGRTGGPGASVPGQPQSPGTNPGNSAGAQQGTRSSTAPMGGMPGAGRGQGSDTDRSKGSPEYLRRKNEELGKVDPTMPAVIGWDATDDEPPPPPRRTANGPRGDG